MNRVSSPVGSSLPYIMCCLQETIRRLANGLLERGVNPVQSSPVRSEITSSPPSSHSRSIASTEGKQKSRTIRSDQLHITTTTSANPPSRRLPSRTNIHTTPITICAPSLASHTQHHSFQCGIAISIPTQSLMQGMPLSAAFLLTGIDTSSHLSHNGAGEPAAHASRMPERPPSPRKRKYPVPQDPRAPQG